MENVIVNTYYVVELISIFGIRSFTMPTFDFLLDTIATEHDVTTYLQLLPIYETLYLVDPIEPMPEYHLGNLIYGQKFIAGSGIGGINETEEMLRYNTRHNINQNPRYK